MPSLGGFEWVIIAGVFLAIPILLIVLIVGAVRRNRAAASPAPIGPAGAGAQPADARLAETDRLLASGQISESEHQAMRSRILGIG